MRAQEGLDAGEAQSAKSYCSGTMSLYAVVASQSAVGKHSPWLLHLSWFHMRLWCEVHQSHFSQLVHGC